MAAPALSALPEAVAEFMQEPRATVITTLDDDGHPFINALTWVLAYDPRTLRLAGDTRAQFIRNLKARPAVGLTILGAGSIWTVYGTARVLSERLTGVPLNPALVQVSDLRIYESIWWGARLTQPPLWDVTYDQAQADRLDAQIFAMMRSFGA